MDDLLEKFRAGEFRALARMISILENETGDRDKLMRQLYPRTGRAYILGVTGSPGTGKSSLVDCLTALLRKRDQQVAIVAVDPTSPFTGGALLGDRIRMQEHAVDQGVFIRSMATRGSLGGLARTTKEVIKAIDAFGFEWIIVETVGVGQAELDIINVSDTTVVVLTPGAGDAVQTIKAGIMEIADVFAVNKGDLPGADKVALEVEMMLDLQVNRMAWRPPVVQTSAINRSGMEDLLNAIEKHRSYLMEKGKFQKKRRSRLRVETLEILDHQWQQLVRHEIKLSEKVNKLLESVEYGECDPYTTASSILDHVVANSRLKLQP